MISYRSCAIGTKSRSSATAAARIARPVSTEPAATADAMFMWVYSSLSYPVTCFGRMEFSFNFMSMRILVPAPRWRLMNLMSSRARSANPLIFFGFFFRTSSPCSLYARLMSISGTSFKYFLRKGTLYAPVFSSRRWVPARWASPRLIAMIPPMLPTCAEERRRTGRS